MDIALECASAGGRCTPPSAIALALARGGGSCACAEWTTAPPTGLRAGIPGAIIIIPGFAFSLLVSWGTVDVDAGTGGTNEIDERMLLRLGRSGAGGALLQGAVGAAGICILLFFGRRNWRTGVCGAASNLPEVRT